MVQLNNKIEFLIQELNLKRFNQFIKYNIFKDNKVIKQIVHQGHNDHTTSFYPLLDELDFKFEDIKSVYINMYVEIDMQFSLNRACVI